MAKEPGWKRTTRFTLLAQRANGREPSERVSFLALHQFGEGHEIGQDVVPLDPMTEWTKRCMSECKAIDAAVFVKEKGYP